MQDSTAYHHHSAGDGCGASTAPPAISRGALGSPGTTHGPRVPAGTLWGVLSAPIRRHPSFDLFHIQNSTAKGKEWAMNLQTHRMGQNMEIQRVLQDLPSLLFCFFCSCPVMDY